MDRNVRLRRVIRVRVLTRVKLNGDPRLKAVVSKARTAAANLKGTVALQDERDALARDGVALSVLQAQLKLRCETLLHIQGMGEPHSARLGSASVGEPQLVDCHCSVARDVQKRVSLEAVEQKTATPFIRITCADLDSDKEGYCAQGRQHNRW